jgi:NAD+ synthase
METAPHLHTDISLHLPTVRQILTAFIKDEVNAAGFERVVIGLSGGVDSALVAALAVEALGRKNVVGVKMPYKTSSPSSGAHADALVKQLGITASTVDITPMVDPFLATQPDMSKLRKGNVMARQRMIVLFDFSARETALVIGTSNKTELLLGYGTQFGDLASAINPIGDLYKTQIWDLAAEMNVPKAIIEKKPTADLWEGQTDEEELGFSYKQVDRLLYFMVDERQTDEELMTLGFEKYFIEKVKRMVQYNQFKRRPPVIAKISHRTINVDFRYPRDWGV